VAEADDVHRVAAPPERAAVAGERSADRQPSSPIVANMRSSATRHAGFDALKERAIRPR
jgi:hypothetical protein